MLNWERSVVKAEERERQLRQGLDRPFAMYVNSVASDSETMKVAFYGANDVEVETPHPFVSGGSWIRAMPEYGTSYVGLYRADETAPQALNTISRQTNVRIRAYREGNSLYRPLMPGEVEMNSVGTAQSYYARRPFIEDRAGLLSRWIDQDRLVIGDRAPVMARQFSQNVNDKLGDEERIGITYRAKNQWEVIYPKYRGNYTSEHFIDLRNPAKANPTILFDHHAGVVLDDKGTPVKLAETGTTLRCRTRYYATNDVPTSFEIDEKGNYKISLSDQAQEGYLLSVPAGKAKIDIAKDEDHTIGGNYTLTVTKTMSHRISEDYKLNVDSNFNTTVKKSYKFTAKDIELKDTSGGGLKISSGKVALGGSSAELLDLIDQTLTAIQSLNVGTGVGPSSPPLNASQFAQIQSKLNSIKGTL